MSFVRNQDFPCKQSVRGELVISVLRNSNSTLGNQHPDDTVETCYSQFLPHKACHPSDGKHSRLADQVSRPVWRSEFRVTDNFNI